MYKYEANQTKEDIFKTVFWYLLLERFQETFYDELTELVKQVDWAFAISIALLSALLIRGHAQSGPVPVSEKVFLIALLVSIGCGLVAKLWPVQYRFSKPTDTLVRLRLTEMISPTLQEGFFKEMDFGARRLASYNVAVNLSHALGLGKKVPETVLQGADESIEALKSFMNSLTWKRWLYRLQLGLTFLALVWFVFCFLTRLPL
jgi:hypothetical protein